MNPNPTIRFKCSKLEAAVREALGLENPVWAFWRDPRPLTRRDLGLMKCLWAIDEEISDLAGIEHAVNLTELNVYYKGIFPPELLAGLTNLKKLRLRVGEMQHEVVTTFHDNGEKRSEIHYKEGLKEGPLIRWHRNGRKQTVGHYQNDKEDGVWTYYEEDGTESTHIEFKAGELLETTANAPPAQSNEPAPASRPASPAKNNLRTIWYDNGQKQWESQVEGGKFHGPFTMWRENGQKSAEGHYKHGKREGLWIYYNEDGTELGRRIFKAGKSVEIQETATPAQPEDPEPADPEPTPEPAAATPAQPADPEPAAEQMAPGNTRGEMRLKVNGKLSRTKPKYTPRFSDKRLNSPRIAQQGASRAIVVLAPDGRVHGRHLLRRPDGIRVAEFKKGRKRPEIAPLYPKATSWLFDRDELETAGYKILGTLDFGGKNTKLGEIVFDFPTKAAFRAALKGPAFPLATADPEPAAEPAAVTPAQPADPELADPEPTPEPVAVTSADPEPDAEQTDAEQTAPEDTRGEMRLKVNGKLSRAKPKYTPRFSDKRLNSPRIAQQGASRALVVLAPDGRVHGRHLLLRPDGIRVAEFKKGRKRPEIAPLYPKATSWLFDRDELETAGYKILGTLDFGGKNIKLGEIVFDFPTKAAFRAALKGPKAGKRAETPSTRPSTKPKASETTTDSPDLDDPETRQRILAEAMDRADLDMPYARGQRQAYLKDTGAPYTGWTKAMLGNGKIESISHYKDGNRDGLYTYWYENGQKSEERTYEKGKGHGLSSNWYENGQKKSAIQWENGRLVQATSWKPSGEKCPDTNLANGNGARISYHENGRKSSEVQFKDYKGDGLSTSWHENGKKCVQCTYKDGKMVGPYFHWYENGKKQYERFYKDGKYDGLCIRWGKNGLKKDECTYKDGKRHGLHTNWIDGKKNYERTYKDGESLSWTQYDRDGTVLVRTRSSGYP